MKVVSVFLGQPSVDKSVVAVDPETVPEELLLLLLSESA